MSIPKLIGIAGAMQAGKSSLASFLGDRICQEQKRKIVAILPMASALKSIIQLCFNATPQQVDGTGEEKETLLACGESCRKVMQTIATDFRNIDPDAWLNSWVNYVSRRTLEADHFIVPDIRFINEVEYIHNNDGMMFWLIRIPQENPHLPKEYAATLKRNYPPHVSEDHIKLRECCYEETQDIIIDNNDMTARECHKYTWAKLMTKFVNQVPTDLDTLKELDCTPGVDRRGEKGLGIQ